MFQVNLIMAWRNVWRNPRRSILTLSAIAFACLLLVFMLSFQFGSYEAMINASVKISTGHLQVQAAGYHAKQDIRKVISHPERIARIWSAMPSVEAFCPRAEAFALISSKDRTYGILVEGVSPEQEKRVSTLADQIREGAYLSPGDTTQALVGRLLARNMGVKPGDALTLLGQARDGAIAATVVTVKGVFESGLDEMDRSVLYLPLAYFQDLFSMDGDVHRMVAISRSLEDVAAIKRKTQKALAASYDGKEKLVVLDWMALMPGLKQGIQMDLVSGIIFYLILIIVVAFSILNTFLMAIFERTREFGVLMAMGTRPGRLTQLLLMESMMLTGIGVLAGIGLGCLITLYFQAHGIDISGASELLKQYGITGRIYPDLSVWSAFSGPLVVMLITLMTALYPALKIRRLKPVDAMTYI